VLTGGRRDAPPRHQTLRNALSWNDDLLSSDEQTLFRRLAVFVGGCSLPAVEAILTATGGMSMSVLDGITALIDKSMLQHSVAGKDEPRLYLLEALREYGLESLTENGELEQTEMPMQPTTLNLQRRLCRSYLVPIMISGKNV
jgi:predicted ATPase